MISLAEFITRGQIASALIIIAAVLSYYVLVIKDRERTERNKRKLNK